MISRIDRTELYAAASPESNFDELAPAGATPVSANTADEDRFYRVG